MQLRSLAETADAIIVSLSDRLPCLERFLDDIRHRHSTVFSPASSESPLLREASFTQGANGNPAVAFRSCYSGLPFQPPPICKRRWKLCRSRTLAQLRAHPKKQLITAQFAAVHRILSRQTGAGCAFRSSAVSGSNRFGIVPRGLLPRSFVPLGTRVQFLPVLPAYPFSLKSCSRFSSTSSGFGCSLAGEASFQMSSPRLGLFPFGTAGLNDGLQSCCCRTP